MNFGEFLKKVREDKSISQRLLAEKSGISNAEISRIETGNRQNPSPDVLRQLAPVLEVPYEVLMEKAGYINDRSMAMAENREAEEKFISIVIPKLVLEGWGVEPLKRPAMGDVIAKKGKEEWHIDFKYFRQRADEDKHFRIDMRIRDILWRTYGRLAIYDKSPITKYSLAVSNEKIFESIIKYPPINLNINISIILISLEEGRIIWEHEFNRD